MCARKQARIVVVAVSQYNRVQNKVLTTFLELFTLTLRGDRHLLIRSALRLSANLSTCTGCVLPTSE